MVGSSVVHAAQAWVSATGFLPHGYCYLWNKPLLWTHVISDVLIGISYIVISVSLVTLMRRVRNDIPFSTIFVAFGTFIIACGLTHFMEVWTLWQPRYWLAGGVKAVTAVASVMTAAIVPFIATRVQTTVRDAKQSQFRSMAAERAAALEESNERLRQQAMELEQQAEAAHMLAAELEESNTALEGQRRSAESANAAKSRFLAAMSHELRTPLNAICGYVDLLTLGVRGTVSANQLIDLERIRVNQQHLLSLINDILDFTTLDEGHLSYRMTNVPIDVTLRATEAMVIPQMQAHGLAYTYEGCDTTLAAYADREKLQQIVLNLLGNAIKFTPRGEHIRLSCSCTGATVRIQVRDTGKGIPHDKLQMIFDPFVQIDRQLNQPVDGVGLGLTISRELAQGMGGDLSVTSVMGDGSTFTLTLMAAGASSPT